MISNLNHSQPFDNSSLRNMLISIFYSGTLVVKGQGIAQVRATGLHTEIGKIGKALQILEPEDTILQRQTSRIVRNFAIIGLSLCAIVIIVFGITRGDWLNGFLAGITLAMATLPEEFPVVLTIFLALGAWRISQHQVLTRRVPAVEMLGAATVLCVDKTGTLTTNRMTVTKLSVGDELISIDRQQMLLPDQFHEIMEYSILASPLDPFDPMEKAMQELAGRTLSDTEHIHKIGYLPENIRCLKNCWPCPMYGNLPKGQISSLPQKARQRRLQTSVIWTGKKSMY